MDYSKTWKLCLSTAKIKAAPPINNVSTKCGREQCPWGMLCPLRMKTVRNSRAMEGMAFFVSQHSSTEMLGSMPVWGWTFCGGRLNVNWKMLPAVKPEHPHLVVLAKKNKEELLLTSFHSHSSPISSEKKSTWLSEIKGEFASYDELRLLK